MDEKEQKTRFNIYASRGDLKQIKRMLRGGFQPTSGALEIASSDGNKELLELLLTTGNYSAETLGYCLSVAARVGQFKCAQMLLDGGADPNTGLGQFLTIPALLSASEKGITEFVGQLLERGAHPNAHDVPAGGDLLGVNVNRTALMAASERGHIEVVRHLLEAGADPFVKGIKGKTAYELVTKRKDRKEIAKLLQAWEKKKPARQKAEKPKAEPRTDAPSPASNGNDALKILEKLLQTESTSHPEEKKIRVFSLAADRVRKLTQSRASHVLSVREYHQALALAREKCATAEVSVFLSFDGSTAEICVAPWKDKFKTIAALKTGSASYGVETKELIATLKKVDVLCPFDLCECGTDSVAGSFSTPVKDAKKLAAMLVNLCPFILEGQSGKRGKFERALKKENRFKLWWD